MKHNYRFANTLSATTQSEQEAGNERKLFLINNMIFPYSIPAEKLNHQQANTEGQKLPRYDGKEIESWI